jgi:hypothetical protein
MAMHEVVTRICIDLLRENKFGGKLICTPSDWSRIALEFSATTPALMKVEFLDNQSVMLLGVCGSQLRVIASPTMPEDEMEFTER